ncbi:MAG: hypothetical protein ABIR05_02735 [Luteimonas sp.]
MHNSPRSRPLSIIAMPLAAMVLVAAVSGCHWFRKDTGYQLSAESRPLEVPPDLDIAGANAAMKLPAEGSNSVTRSSMTPTRSAAATIATNSFIVPGERDAVFEKVGQALVATPGVTIASKAQLLGVYDVAFEGADFLVRVSKVDAGVQVAAVDPRGVSATGAAATKLVAALKVALGG